MLIQFIIFTTVCSWSCSSVSCQVEHNLNQLRFELVKHKRRSGSYLLCSVQERQRMKLKFMLMLPRLVVSNILWRLKSEVARFRSKSGKALPKWWKACQLCFEGSWQSQLGTGASMSLPPVTGMSGVSESLREPPRFNASPPRLPPARALGPATEFSPKIHQLTWPVSDSFRPLKQQLGLETASLAQISWFEIWWWMICAASEF